MSLIFIVTEQLFCSTPVLEICLLTVSVDDAVEDIVRQFKGISDGFVRKVSGTSFSTNESSSPSPQNSVWNSDELDKTIPRQNTGETLSTSEHEETENSRSFVSQSIDREEDQSNGLDSDNELNSKGSPAHRVDEFGNLDVDRKHDLVLEARVSKEAPTTSFSIIPDNLEDVPPEVY